MKNDPDYCYDPGADNDESFPGILDEGFWWSAMALNGDDDGEEQE